MVSVASLVRVRDQLLLALTYSPSLTASAIVVSTIVAVLFGAVLTPPSNASSIPFVIPTLIAAAQNARWVWATALSMIPLYILIAFGLESVPFSAGLVNFFGLILFGCVFSWVASQRQRVEQHAEALEQMEDNLRFAMLKSDVRLFSHDTELRYSWLPNPNPAFPRKQMLGQTDEALFPPDEAQAIMAVKRQALEEEREVRAELVVKRDDEPRIYHLTAVPNWRTDSDGKRQKVGISCVSIDITELHRAVTERDDLVRRQEQALWEAARAKDNLERFTSMIAHDLVQPLTIIQGHSDVLRRRLGAEGFEQHFRTLDALNRSVERTLRLIDDLRDVAALQQGRFSLSILPVDVVSVLENVVQDYQATTQLHLINLSSPGQLWGYVDESRLGQLTGNLLSNAIKYSPEGGDIDVHVSSERNMCQIRVTDHGRGMPPDSIHHLFDMFTRLDHVHNTEGLGLGLFISRGIVEAHGGSISVESTPGIGSTFLVMLPLSPRVVADGASQPVPNRPPPGVA